MPGYQDEASFIIFSPPVTNNMADRLSVTFFSDFTDKSIRGFLDILERTFHRIKA
jgi:hypothetical protein